MNIHRNKPQFAVPRRHSIGDSEARIIIVEDEAALIRLWQQKRGEAEPEDLSVNLTVQLGLTTEDLIGAATTADTGRRSRMSSANLQAPDDAQDGAATLDQLGGEPRRCADVAGGPNLENLVMEHPRAFSGKVDAGFPKKMRPNL